MPARFSYTGKTEWDSSRQGEENDRRVSACWHQKNRAARSHSHALEDKTAIKEGTSPQQRLDPVR